MLQRGLSDVLPQRQREMAAGNPTPFAASPDTSHRYPGRPTLGHRYPHRLGDVPRAARVAGRGTGDGGQARGGSLRRVLGGDSTEPERGLRLGSVGCVKGKGAVGVRRGGEAEETGVEEIVVFFVMKM